MDVLSNFHAHYCECVRIGRLARHQLRRIVCEYMEREGGEGGGEWGGERVGGEDRWRG